MGENRGGEPGVGIKTEPCRRKSRDVGPREISPPLSLLPSVMAFCFGPCSVWFLASTWSVGRFPFCSGVFIFEILF